MTEGAGHGDVNGGVESADDGGSNDDKGEDGDVKGGRRKEEREG